MSRRTIFYDTETTGLNPERDRIIEIAAYDPTRDLTFQRLIHPGCPIPPESSAVHKITDQMVANSPNFGEVAREFMQFCEGDVVLIAHNNDAFDVQFLRCEFPRHQLEMPSWQFLDSLKWARRYRPDLPRHSLQFLREIYGIPANTAHRALDDVIVLHKVFSLLTDDLSIDQVLTLLAMPKQRPAASKDPNQMPFGKHQGKPLQEVPRNYLQWLAGSGALDKPENQELRSTLQKLGILP